MKYYLQINEKNIITDVINYESEGYILYETELPFMAGINGGWWKLENGIVVEYPELKPTDNNKILEDLIQLLIDKGVIF